MITHPHDAKPGGSGPLNGVLPSRSERGTLTTTRYQYNALCNHATPMCVSTTSENGALSNTKQNPVDTFQHWQRSPVLSASRHTFEFSTAGRIKSVTIL
mmetsp:Transcript_5818/g.17470  ORF Transcript_5818/g.17470 Transcript_5818/m.17470 type:complete len:99 (+) Transcript_5818:178-474(+)